MQDKDIDQLFKQRFEDLEVEPSDRSWQKITRELDGSRRKRKSFSSYWIAAASVILVTGAFLWMYKPVEVIKLQGKPEEQVVVNENKEAENKPPLATNETGNESAKAAKTTDGLAGKMKIAVSRRKANAEKAFKPEKQILPENIKTVDPAENRAMFAKQVVKSSLPETETGLAKETEKPVVVASLDVNEAEINAVAETSRPRIKSIGGLVNFVIAQVDKRENKIIEFKDGEEGSEVSGINLGLVKFKNRNR